MASPARDNPRVLPQCPGCRERDLRITQLEQQLVALLAEKGACTTGLVVATADERAGEAARMQVAARVGVVGVLG